MIKRLVLMIIRRSVNLRLQMKIAKTIYGAFNAIKTYMRKLLEIYGKLTTSMKE